MGCWWEGSVSECIHQSWDNLCATIVMWQWKKLVKYWDVSGETFPVEGGRILMPL